jgi:hypothetical protein
MASTQRSYTKEEVDKMRAHISERAKADPSINVEESLQLVIANRNQSMDVVWGDVQSLSTFAMALDGEESSKA